MKGFNFKYLFFILFPASFLKAQEPAAPKTNVIFILADDLGIHDLGAYGQKKIKTPNLDRMAREGILFTNHYAGSTVCAPSRGSLMTGLHTGSAYIKGNYAMDEEGNLPLPDETITVAEIFKSEGYNTGVVGKWGLGGPKDSGHPNNQGFDYSLCYLDQRLAHEYYPEHLWENTNKIDLNNRDNNTAYSHDLFTEAALNFISDNSAYPFFLYLPYTIPHGKYQIPDNSLYAHEAWSENQKNYAAMISLMDADIGKIFNLLDSLNIDEHTLVLFASDNGGVRGVGSFFESNSPYRGFKTQLYEGGIRVPLIARWPSKIKAGSVTDHISAFWDFLPTVCDLLGVDPPENSDGISYRNTLLSKNQEKHEFLYWEYFHYDYNWNKNPGSQRNYLESQAVRLGDWKGVRHNMKNDPTAPIELYNLAADAEEAHNVAGRYPEVVKEITAVMASEHKDTPFFKTD